MTDPEYDMGPATEVKYPVPPEFDDEQTLDEEEALEGSEDSHELSNLQKEGDMPLKDLLAMYGYGDPSTENSDSSDHMLLPSGSGDPETEERYSDKGDNDADDDDDDDEADANSNEPDLKQFYTEMLVKGKDKTSSIQTTKSSSGGGGTGSGDSRRHRIDDDDDDDEDAEADECAMGSSRSGNANTRSSPTAAGTNAVACTDIVNLGGCSATDATNSTIEGAASGAIDVPEDGIVSTGIGSGSSRLLRSVSRPQSEEEEDDCDYSPDEEEWKKTIMVGSDFQAAIPEGLWFYDDALPYENEDKLLWDPTPISEEDTNEFLERAQLPAVKGGSLPAGPHIRDDEQALYLLLQCGYNLEEALRRRRMNVVPSTEAVSLWSEEECHNFESGLRTYGKDFHLIQKNKVRTRSVGELVQFYYLWKKTERHDIFTYKARLEKKKYALHPGITDYMDRFLEEQEGVRDRSSSPNVNYLLYGDAKRQRSSASVINNDETKTETWDGNPVDPLADINGPTPPAPPPPPPPPPLATSAATTISSTMCSSSTLNTPASYCPSSARHPDGSSSESDCTNSLVWNATTARTQPTSSVITTITINTTTASTSAAAVTAVSSMNTVTTSSTVTATAATAVSNSYYHQRVTSSRSNDSHDSPSPENILPHLPP